MIILESGVYAILDERTHQMYIGSAKCIKSRVAYHRSQLKRGKHYNIGLQEAFFARHPLRYIPLIQYDRYDKKAIASVERQLIQAFRTQDPRYGFNVYN
ncbi:MAG: GIY-YIG nuclease family protein [Acidibacillus sp.]|nr:GIY-YIG nuclease family protein [Acidibacillus sp.]